MSNFMVVSRTPCNGSQRQPPEQKHKTLDNETQISPCLCSIQGIRMYQLDETSKTYTVRFFIYILYISKNAPLHFQIFLFMVVIKTRP
jgi:hypothetical protein